MGDNPPAAQQLAQPKQYGYQGNPDKQKNPRAKNLWKPKDKKPAKEQAPVPKHLPPPRQDQQQTTPKLTNETIKHSAFSTDFCVREICQFEKFKPSAANLIDVADQIFSQLRVEDHRLDRQMLPEYVRYYCAALFWMRAVAIKDATTQPLTDEEMKLLIQAQAITWAIPEPLHIYLKQYGSFVTPTETKLAPEFPPLPIQVVQGFGGYYGPINTDNHNLYEEIPSLGVLAEGIRMALSNADPGPYVSSLSDRANYNLLGYKPLASRHREAKQTAHCAGIYHNAFPETIRNTAINIDMLKAVSNYLVGTTTFKIQNSTINALGVSGTSSQLVNLRPVDNGDTIKPYLKTELNSFTMARESPTHMGIGLYLGAQLWKEGAAHDWCCINAVRDHPIPPAWIANRNSRRTSTPTEYQVDRFSGTAYTLTDWTRLVVERLVSAKR